MSSPSMANPLPAIPPALFFLVPLFAVVILLLALSHRPAHCGANQSSKNRGAFVSYLAIASLALLSTLTGALGLTASSASTDPSAPVALSKAKAESVVQAFLFLELGISVLYLSSGYVSLSPILKAYTTLLVISLSSATLLALLLPFVSTSFPAYLPPVLYLSYATLTLPLVAHTFRQFLHGTSNSDSESSIPLSLSLAPLPSPTASSASFPSAVSHHEKLPSISSSTSTLTAVDHWQSNAPDHRHLTVPFPAPYDVENVQVARPSDDGQYLSSRIVRSRSRSLLVFLLAAQCAALIGLIFDIVATILMTASSRNGIATSGTSIYALLQIVQAAFIVLCITGVMSAYLLHAYNAYLPMPSLKGPADTLALAASGDSLGGSQAMIGLSPPRPHLTVLSPPPVRSSPKFKVKSIAGGAGRARASFHTRVASTSSSFSSPRPQRVPLSPPQDLMTGDPSDSQVSSPCSPDVVRGSQDSTPAPFSPLTASLPIPIPTRWPSPEPMPYPTPNATPTFSNPVPFLGTPRQSVAGGVTFLPDIDAHERARAHVYARRGSRSPCPSLGTMRKRVSTQSQVVDKEWEGSSVQLPKRTKSQHSSKMRQQLEQPLGLGLGLGLKGKTKYPLTIHSHGRGAYRFPVVSGGVPSSSAKVVGAEIISGTRVGEGSEEGGAEEGESGDFMDLRDPFACPPPGVNVVSSEDKDGSERALSWYGRGRGQQGQRLSAWGRLPPLPPIPSSPSLTSLASSKTGRLSKNPKSRVGRKGRHGKESAKLGGREDVDFDVEEALLAQRLLRRLDLGSLDRDAGG